MDNLQEVAPPGWEGSVMAMKKHPEIDNPFALAWSMKNKGDKPHYQNKKGKPKKKKKYKHESFQAWLDNKKACEAQGKPGGTSALGIPSCGDHSFQDWVKQRATR